MAAGRELPIVSIALESIGLEIVQRPYDVALRASVGAISIIDDLRSREASREASSDERKGQEQTGGGGRGGGGGSSRVYFLAHSSSLLHAPATQGGASTVDDDDNDADTMDAAGLPWLHGVIIATTDQASPLYSVSDGCSGDVDAVIHLNDLTVVSNLDTIVALQSAYTLANTDKSGVAGKGHEGDAGGTTSEEKEGKEVA